MRGGLLVEQEGEFVAVRPDDGGAVGAFAVAGPGEFHGEIGLHAGLVFEAEFLGIVGNAAVGEAREGGDAGQEFAAGGDELVAEGDEFLGKTVEQGGVRSALFQQGIARAEGVSVALEEGQVGGLGLGEEQVEEAAAGAGGAFDKLQIFGAKHDGAQGAEVVGEAADGLGVQGDFPLGSGPIHFDFVRGVAHHGRADEVAFGRMADHLRTADAAKGTQGGEEVDGFEDVGFALGVVAQQEVEAGAEIRIEPRVIAEIAESQVGQMHGWRLARCGRKGERESGGGKQVPN